VSRALIGTLLLLIAAIPAAGHAAIGDPARGQTMFVEKGCVHCHAVRGAGGRVGPDLGRSAVKGSFYDVVAAMWNHVEAMNDRMEQMRLVRPRFEGSEMADLLAFLYFLNYFDEPGDVRRGKALFNEKHCIQCHAVGREGGRTAPRLDVVERGTPPLKIAQDLWNHGPGMTAAMRARNLEVPAFRGNEIVDLFAFLRSQGQRRSARVFESAGDPAQGRALFASKGCVRCHAVSGAGGRIGPDLGVVELQGSVTQLAGRMWNHWPEMSGAMQSMGMATPVFEDNELADVFAYLFISRYDALNVAPRRGGEIYREKRCASCHGLRGEGGVGPSLAAVKGEPKEEIARRLWNHAPLMRQTMADRRIPWPRLTAGELAALIRLMADGWPAEPGVAGAGASRR
jgi:mono/diheme cytochrome c family protein